MSLQNVHNIVLVLSGKGGVGKSSVTTQLALTLSLKGYSVGVLDVDLTGPSIPRFFGVENAKVRQAPGGWIPVSVHESHDSLEGQAEGQAVDQAVDQAEDQAGVKSIGSLSCMSLGFVLSSRSDAVIWRGPKKTAMVRQFLDSVLWPADLDFLLIDTPPGTSDEHISLLETLLKTALPEQLSGAVVVTTPQAISISDVKKELNFCSKVGLTVLGVIENMAGFVCPNCHECTDLFSKGGGQAMAADFNVPFLGSVPIDPAFVMLIEEGTVPTYPEGTVIEGSDFGSKESKPEMEAGDQPKLLVEKYRRCSLYPLFDKVVKTLVVEIERHKELPLG